MRSFNFVNRRARRLQRLYTHAAPSNGIIPLKDEVNPRLLISRYFNGIDRPRVLSTLIDVADHAGARVSYFDFSTNLLSIPCYHGTLGLYVYKELLQDSLSMFDGLATWEDRVKSRFLRTRWEWPLRTRDEQWIFRFRGEMQYGGQGILELTDYLSARRIGLARFEGESHQSGAGYGLRISGTLRARIDEIDDDTFRTVRRQLRSGVVPALKEITFSSENDEAL